MAFTIPGAGSIFVVTAEYVDDEQNNVKREFYVPFDTDIATTLGNAVTLLGLLQPLTNALLGTASLSVPLQDAVATAAVANHPVSANAMVTAKLDTNFGGKPNYQVLGLPAPVDALFLPPAAGSKTIVDTTNADLVALISAFQTGGAFTFKNGQVAVPNEFKGTKRYRKSNQ